MFNKKALGKFITLFLTGGILYYVIEIVWRIVTHSLSTHPAMIIVGGIAFIAIGGINEWLSWDMPLIYQCAIGMIIVYTIEFITGCILNIWLGLGIWDYSCLPMNLLGQICPQFAIAWFMLSLIAIMLDDYLRFLIWKEEKPRYRLV